MPLPGSWETGTCSPNSSFQLPEKDIFPNSSGSSLKGALAGSEKYTIQTFEFSVPPGGKFLHKTKLCIFFSL